MAAPCGRLSGAGKRFLWRLEGFRGQRNGDIAKLCENSTLHPAGSQSQDISAATDRIPPARGISTYLSYVRNISAPTDLDNQVTNLDNLWTLATPSYSDQVLPFNVTLTGANEYGAMTCAKILGIEILVIDQVSPGFRPACHLCNPLPYSAAKYSFQLILALAFRIYRAGREQAETTASGCRLPGADISAESAETGILGVQQVRKSGRISAEILDNRIYLLSAEIFYLPDRSYLKIEGYRPSWARAKPLNPPQPSSAPPAARLARPPVSPPAAVGRSSPPATRTIPLWLWPPPLTQLPTTRLRGVRGCTSTDRALTVNLT